MPTISWDHGTAYDFFISLVVLHQAATFGLRPSWAAGVRQRLSPPHRDFLERIYSFSGTGLDWVCSLPQPKDADDVLHRIAQLDPARRLDIMLPAEIPVSVRDILNTISERGSALRTEREFLKTSYPRRHTSLTPAALDSLVQTWVNPGESGEQLLAALQEYQRVFFSEEEQRLRPVLETGLTAARGQAEQMTVDALIESLSRGVRLGNIDTVSALILAPSFWASPLVFHLRIDPEKTLIVFGVRSSLQGIVPGANAPDLLMTTLKALADPTRLRILRLLQQEPYSTTELAHQLRLRPPTVIHHLQALRLAGLVQITISENNERGYAPRLEALGEFNRTLQDFLTGQDTDE